ncbi:MAG: MarR family winged helix-turn-helix transcriptional regulator [Acidimicrobiales bacterium]
MPSKTAGQPTPAPEGSADGVAEAEAALTRMMRQAARPATWRKVMAAGGFSLDRAEYLTLARIEEASAAGPVRLTDLAEAMGIDISTASRQVRSVAEAGLVERTCDPQDQRASRLRLTPAGRSTLARARRASQEAMSKLLITWSVADRRTLARLLDRLVEQLAAMGTADPGPLR